MPKSVSVNTTLTCDFCGKVRENFPTERRDYNDCWSILKYFLDKGESEDWVAILCPQCRSVFLEIFRVIRYRREGGETVTISKEGEAIVSLDPPFEFTEEDAQARHRQVSTYILNALSLKHPDWNLKFKSAKEAEEEAAKESLRVFGENHREWKLKSMSDEDLLTSCESDFWTNKELRDEIARRLAERPKAS